MDVMDVMNANTADTTSTNLTLFQTSVKFYFFVTMSYAVIYFLYTTLLANDYALARESTSDTIVNCFFTAAFVSAGSTPTELEHKSSLARLVLASHVTLSVILRVWMITV